MSDRPNVLFIITDQQRADHVGFMGNEVVRTPNLDGLAARGTIFENAWVSNPVCMPNRSTIMTGRMPSAHGVIFNDRSLEWGAATHVRQFRDAGWRTALIGKSHLQHGMSRNAVFPVQRTATVDHGYADTWDGLEDFERYDPAHPDGAFPDWPDDFYGFGHVELSIDHGARLTGHHLRWALEKGGRYEDLVVPYSPDAPALRRSEKWWQVYQPPYAPELHSTSFVTERTIAFIEESATADQPWLAWSSFPDPHHPMTPPGEWYDRHSAADMKLPASLNDRMEHSPAHLRRVQATHPRDQRAWVGVTGVGDADLLQECIAATYGSIEFIDHGIGRILAAVDSLGQTENTIVVFTSDHGDMMGDHGLLLKGFMHYRGTVQVPMVITDPRRPPGRSTSLAGSIDLGSTLMDLCDVPPHDGIQGRPLTPILDNPAAIVRDHVLVEDDLRTVTANAIKVPARTRTLVSEDGWKYTRCSTGESMLFDLGDDPLELTEIGHADPIRRGAADTALVDAMMAASDEARGAPVS